MPSRLIGQALWGLAFFLTAGLVGAGSFSVSPVRATLSVKQSVASMAVRNRSDEPAVIQIELANWSQKDGSDILTPSKEILATPPIFTLPPGGTQVVRIGMRRAPDRLEELSYRMFLQEVPPPPRPGHQGLQVALRLSIPIFIIPAGDARPAVRWKATPGRHGEIKLHATNSGNAHIQIASLTLSGPDGQALLTRQVAAYLLRGESREWTVPADLEKGQSFYLDAKTDWEDIRSEITVEAP